MRTKDLSNWKVWPGLEERATEAFGELTVAEIARVMGRNYHTVRHHLKARRPVPIEFLIQLSVITNCTVDWFVTGREPKYHVIKPVGESMKPVVAAPQQFPDRLRKACGSDEPAEIEKVLGVSQESVTNYLAGQLPTAEALIRISRLTKVSIHWLLTGEGSRKVEPDLEGTGHSLVLSQDVKTQIRHEVVRLLSELLYAQEP